jgi:plasmid replication initiation protein
MKIPEETQVPRLLNQAVHNFDSVLSKRIFWAAMSQIKKGFAVQKDLFENLWISIPTSILNDQNYDRLVKASQQITKGRFEFNNEKEETFLHVVPFPVASYTKHSGEIRVKVESEAYKILGELSQGYFWLKLKSVMTLSSKYAQRWYELLTEKKTMGDKWEGVTVDEIRKMMSIDEFEYKENKNFLKRVIYDPIAEINEKTELSITYFPMHNQKKPIIGFDFRIQNQEQKGESAIYDKIERYFDDFRALSPTEKALKIQELQRVYTFPEKDFNEMFMNPHLLNAVLETDAKIKAGKLEVKLSKGQYMAGVIKKAKSNLK